MKFNAIVNPFLHEVKLTCKDKKTTHEIVFNYESIDEWNSFEIDGKTFDIQFHYDAEFLISIYPVENNKVDFSKSQNVKIKFKLTD